MIGLVVFGSASEAGGHFYIDRERNTVIYAESAELAEEIFHNNKEIKEWLDSLTLDWDKIINEVVKFFTSGASSVLGSTFVVARRIASGITTFVIAFVFACYILLQKEKLNIQIRKVMYAYMKEDLVKKGSGCLFSELPYIFEFPDRTVSGGRDSGNDVCDLYGNPADAICDAHWCSDRVYCADSDFRGIYWLRSGSISDPDGGADEGFGFCDHVPDPSADRGKSDLSESGGQFCGTSVYLGAGSGQYRSQSDGNRGNAGFHSNRFRAVCTSPWGCL